MIIIDIHERSAYYTFTAHGDGSETGDMKGPVRCTPTIHKKIKRLRTQVSPK